MVCSNQEATQVSALNFARHHCRLFVEHVKDPGHRAWNDVWGALSDAHLAKTAMLTLNLYNAKYGPWNKSGWFAKVQETAKTLSENLGPNDPLLQMFMPGILEDTRRDESENTESMSPTASKSRFFSASSIHPTGWTACGRDPEHTVYAAGNPPKMPETIRKIQV